MFSKCSEYKNDEVPGQKQSNAFYHLGISVGSSTPIIYKAWFARNSEVP